MVDFLTDADVCRVLTSGRAIERMRDALAAERRGALRCPPRAHTDLGDGELVSTTCWSYCWRRRGHSGSLKREHSRHHRDRNPGLGVTLRGERRAESD